MIGALLVAVGSYLAIGIIYAAYFVAFKLPSFDALTSNSPRRFRLIVFPGCVGLWPVLLLQSLQKAQVLSGIHR